MPELRTLQIPATEVKDGDLYRGLPVQSVKVGRKWVNLRGSFKPQISLSVDETVEVQREFPTEVELAWEKDLRAAQMREHAARRLAEQLEAALENTPQKALLELAASERSFGLVDSWQIDKLLQVQAEFDFYAEVRSTLDHWAENSKPSVYAYDEDIFAAFAVTYLKHTAGATTRNPLSRSSSATSNLVDDLKVYTAEKICDRMYATYAKEIALRVSGQRNRFEL